MGIQLGVGGSKLDRKTRVGGGQPGSTNSDSASPRIGKIVPRLGMSSPGGVVQPGLNTS